MIAPPENVNFSSAVIVVLVSETDTLLISTFLPVTEAMFKLVPASVISFPDSTAPLMKPPAKIKSEAEVNVASLVTLIDSVTASDST